MSRRYRGRLGLHQRVLPNYRVPFFDLLAAACEGGLSVFAGQPMAQEGIQPGLPRRAEYAAANNVHILGGPFYLCHQRGLISWLETWNPDALIMEANPRYLATSSAVRWMHARGKRVIGWGLGAPPVASLFGGLRAQFLRQFDALISYSRRGAREYEQAGIAPQKIHVAINAVTPRPTRVAAREPRSGQATILFVGRLQKRKHVDVLLRACSEMPGPRPRLVIVGDGPERSRLETLARRSLPAAEFVGPKHGTELDAYFEDADLFVLPGTGGLAVQEAMAHCLPVIVARGDGTQDDLIREENGWQIEADDYRALVATMHLALSDAAKLRRMGAASSRIVAEEVNLERMVEVFVDTLEGPD